MKPVTLADYLKGRDEEYPEEWTPEREENALDLLVKVNSLLEDCGVEYWSVSSGWRPSVINSATPGSAKHSYHLEGKAIDLVDNKVQTLGKLIICNAPLLKKYELWMEDLNYTKGPVNWVHLDTGKRKDRELRTFKP